MLRILSQKKRRAFISSFLGTTLPVLCESRVKNGRMSGLTTNYIRVEFSQEEAVVNDIHLVRLIGIDHDTCIGEIQTHHRGDHHYRETATIHKQLINSHSLMESQ